MLTHCIKAPFNTIAMVHHEDIGSLWNLLSLEYQSWKDCLLVQRLWWLYFKHTITINIDCSQCGVWTYFWMGTGPKFWVNFLWAINVLYKTIQTISSMSPCNTKHTWMTCAVQKQTRSYQVVNFALLLNIRTKYILTNIHYTYILYGKSLVWFEVI